jgi:hypothetical protein
MVGMAYTPGMTWGKDGHLWEGVIAGVVMAVTWVAMTGGLLPAPLTPALLNAIGIAGRHCCWSAAPARAGTAARHV